MTQFRNPFKNAKLYRYPQGDIVQLFGENPILYAFLGLNGHNGIDIFQPYGTSLFAVCDGEIADIKFTSDGYGLHIRLVSDWIDDTCYEITYGHLVTIKEGLTVGRKVKKGEEIGSCGNSGFVVSGGVPHWGNSNPDKKGTHLHFGVREYSKQNTNWQSSYSNGKTYFVKNYENGYKGAIDPNPFLLEEIVKQGLSVVELAKRIINEVLKHLRLSFN